MFSFLQFLWAIILVNFSTLLFSVFWFPQLYSSSTSPFILQTVGRKCFEKCITKPGSSLGGSESSCISRCVDRYIEATGIISKALFTSQWIGQLSQFNFSTFWLPIYRRWRLRVPGFFSCILILYYTTKACMTREVQAYFQICFLNNCVYYIYFIAWSCPVTKISFKIART